MRLRRLALLLAVAVLTACGKTGPPVAPETRLPQPVADLKAVVEDGGIVLTWTNPTVRADNKPLHDPKETRVYRNEDDGQGFPRVALLHRGRIAGWDEVSKIALPQAPSAKRAPRAERQRFVDREGLTPGRRYSYVVLTEDAQGRVSLPSGRVSVFLIAAPEPPSDLTAVAGEGEVRLDWQPPQRLADGSPVPGPLTYEVLRGTDPAAPGENVTPKPIETTTFVDKALANDRTYHYSVRALRQEGETLARGTATETVAATPRDMTAPAPPSDLLAIPTADSVRLSWRPSSDADVASYAVYRAAAGQAFTRVGSTPAVRAAYVDAGVAPGTYQYAVTALDSAAQPNESERSNVVTVTVPARSR